MVPRGLVWRALLAKLGGQGAALKSGIVLAHSAFIGGGRRRYPMETTMPRGDKDSYTDKQKRKAEHIEEGYEKRGTSREEAERRAWATVNKESGGGNKSGSGRGKADSHVSSSRGGKAHKSGSYEQRSAAARKGWETRRKHAHA
jgi:plasmid stabilization system protein ParE